MQNTYWLKGLLFGIIAGIAVIIGGMLLRLGGANDISYYPYVFGYTLFVSIVIFSIAGLIIRKDWTSLTKGIVIGILGYIILLLPIVLPETLYCSTLSEKGMCGLFSIWAFLFLSPSIPIGGIIGWIYGKRKGESHSSMGLGWLKGGISGLVVWLLVAFISEHFYFYGQFPEIWKTVFFGRGESRALWIYIIIGIILGWLYGKIKNRNKLII